MSIIYADQNAPLIAASAPADNIIIPPLSSILTSHAQTYNEPVPSIMPTMPDPFVPAPQTSPAALDTTAQPMQPFSSPGSAIQPMDDYNAMPMAHQLTTAQDVIDRLQPKTNNRDDYIRRLFDMAGTPADFSQAAKLNEIRAIVDQATTDEAKDQIIKEIYSVNTGGMLNGLSGSIMRAAGSSMNYLTNNAVPMTEMSTIGKLISAPMQQLTSQIPADNITVPIIASVISSGMNILEEKIRKDFATLPHMNYTPIISAFRQVRASNISPDAH